MDQCDGGARVVVVHVVNGMDAGLLLRRQAGRIPPDALALEACRNLDEVLVDAPIDHTAGLGTSLWERNIYGTARRL